MFKISIVGAGKLGTAVAQQLIQQNYVDIIALFDTNHDYGKARALDLQHSISLIGGEQTVVFCQTYEGLSQSDVVVIAAGKPKQDTVGREDLLLPNIPVVKEIALAVQKHAPNSIIIVATNPYDAMTSLVLTVTGFPRERVFGSGGLLYGSRFKALASERLTVSVRDVETVMIGGGSPRFTPVLSHTKICGKPITEVLSFVEMGLLVKKTRLAAYEIICLLKDSAAYIAPAAAIVVLIREIVRPSGVVISAALQAEGEYGVYGVLNLPIRVSQSGVEQVVALTLTEEEQYLLKEAARHIQWLTQRMSAA